MTTCIRVRGFTLLELLVVVILIALLATAAIITMPSTSVHDRQREEAQRLLGRLDLAHEEAILQARSVGLQVTQDGYRFVWFEDDAWHNFAANHPLRRHELPADVRLDIRVEGTEIGLGGGEDDDDDERAPQIYFLAGGEVLPDYELRILTTEDRAAEGRSDFLITAGDETWFELREDRF